MLVKRGIPGSVPGRAVVHVGAGVLGCSFLSLLFSVLGMCDLCCLPRASTAPMSLEDTGLERPEPQSLACVVLAQDLVMGNISFG